MAEQVKGQGTYSARGNKNRTTATINNPSSVASGPSTQPQTNMAVQSPSPYAANTAIPAIDAANALRTTIRAGGSIYDTAFNAADPQQFAAASSAFFDNLRKTNVYGASQGFANDLEYLQAAVRSGGQSKGTSNVGDISLEDYSAIQKVFQTSYLRGYDWATTLQRDLNSPYRSGGAGGAFTKTVATAMNLLDATDAENRLSSAYFQAFGVYPTQKKIEAFRVKYNAEAKAQATVSTTVSGPSSTKTSNANEGFTAAEQTQFLADFLKSNYNITGKEKSGYVTNVIATLKNAYSSNMIPEENVDSMIKFAADLIGTADTKIQDQKLATKLQGIRDVAAKQYMGLADTFANGQDASAVVDPIIKTINTTLGTNINRNDARIKQIVNYNDGKTTRVMNATELDNFIQKQPEFQTSPAGYSKYANLGQIITGALR
jgi:hypothetical protein